MRRLQKYMTMEEITNLFNFIWQDEEVIKDWGEGEIATLPKKGALKNCNNWCGLSLLSVPGCWLMNVYRSNTSGSRLIAQQIINSRNWVSEFSVDRFSILSRSHSSYHFKVLESLYIRSCKPSLCKQRDCLLESMLLGSRFPWNFFFFLH